MFEFGCILPCDARISRYVIRGCVKNWKLNFSRSVNGKEENTFFAVEFSVIVLFLESRLHAAHSRACKRNALRNRCWCSGFKNSTAEQSGARERSARKSSSLFLSLTHSLFLSLLLCRWLFLWSSDVGYHTCKWKKSTK